jgi:hypothetical protein
VGPVRRASKLGKLGVELADGSKFRHLQADQLVQISIEALYRIGWGNRDGKHGRFGALRRTGTRAIPLSASHGSLQRLASARIPSFRDRPAR